MAFTIAIISPSFYLSFGERIAALMVRLLKIKWMKKKTHDIKTPVVVDVEESNKNVSE